MPNFGKYAEVKEFTHVFSRDDRFWWKYKMPDTDDESRRNHFETYTKETRDEKGGVVVRGPSTTEMMVNQLSMLFLETNIPEDDTPIEEGGDPAIKGFDGREVSNLLFQMPYAMVVELFEDLGKNVPGWGFRSK